MKQSDDRVRQLYRDRPKSWFLRWNVLALLAVIAVAWLQLDVNLGEVFSERRLKNLKRFVEQDAYPLPLRDQPFSLSALQDWVAGIWHDKGAEATLATLSISIVAIIMAGAAAITLVFPASRNVATREPFLPAGRSTSALRRWKWTALTGAVRAAFIVARAIPEYILAFLLIAMIGPGAWPAILALAIHNFGILGKLSAEVVENVEPTVPSALRGQGLSRAQISITALFPMSLSKWLLFFFYRWETCIREATVLGTLGIASLGFWVTDARARDRYDDMVLFILMGALLVLVGDLVSALTRRFVRRA